MLFLFLACTTEEAAPPKQNETQIVEQNKEVGEEPPVIEEKQPVNAPPRIKEAKFTIEKPTTKDQIKVDVDAEDPEGLPLRFDYAWKVNGKSFHSETREFLRKVKVKKGDEVEVTITATDGVSESKKTITNTIVNASPEWNPDPRTIKEINGFQVSAEDPDGDKIFYKLQGQPKGMTISSNGVLSYVGSEEEPGGQYSIVVIAEDPQKAQVQWKFSISLSAGSKAKK